MNKKTKILLMLGWSEYFLGCETHTYTMAKEMVRLGHEVHIFTYLKNEMWKKMGESGVKLLKDDIEDEYDIAIINNNACILRAPKSAYKIFISNGVIPLSEHPIEGMDRYVAVSEEVKHTLRSLGYDSVIIRNGIDCERFKSTSKIKKKLKNVLLISNKQNPHSKEFLVIDEVCRKMKLHLAVCGLQFGTSTWEVEEFINQADLVITLGRGVYEAMACERNVLIADYQEMDGLVDDDVYYEARKHNCSGRRFHHEINLKNITERFDRYDLKHGKRNRQLILKDNNITKTVENYLNLYKFRKLNI